MNLKDISIYTCFFFFFLIDIYKHIINFLFKFILKNFFIFFFFFFFFFFLDDIYKHINNRSFKFILKKIVIW